MFIFLLCFPIGFRPLPPKASKGKELKSRDLKENGFKSEITFRGILVKHWNLEIKTRM